MRAIIIGVALMLIWHDHVLAQSEAPNPIVAPEQYATKQDLVEDRNGSNVSLKVTRDSKQFEFIGAALRLQVHNPHGDVRIRAGIPGKLEVFQVVQHIGSPPIAPQFQAKVDGQNAKLAIRYKRLPKPHHGRIDLVVFVPSGTHLKLKTVDGLIEVKSPWTGSIQARTKGGKISIAAANTVQVRSTSGPIVAGIFPGKRIGSSKIRSITGNITLSVEKSALVQLHLNGCLPSSKANPKPMDNNQTDCVQKVRKNGSSGAPLQVYSKVGRIDWGLFGPQAP